jgi:hypothetical protein
MSADRLARLAARNGNHPRDKQAKTSGLPEGLEPWEPGAPPATEPGNGAGTADSPPADGPAADGAAGEAELLRQENAELRCGNVQLRELLEQAQAEQESWTRREREYENLLEEKSEVIRDLHRRLQEAPPQAGGRTGGDVPEEEELLALHEELERERRQLKEDEESLMKQMRDMELQMSRERAEMARQRNELQRLHTEIQHELELAERDATLRERLAPLQRRAQEALHRRAPTQSGQTPAAPAATPAAPQAKPAKDSSLLRRLFR